MKIIGSGPKDAKIVIVADHPTYAEKVSGQPLAGVSDTLVKQWLAPHGLYRSDVRIENFCEYVPKGGKLDTVPIDALEASYQDFHYRMSSVRPNVIVPLGEYATYALTGKGKVKAAFRKAIDKGDIKASEAEKKAGVTVLRGSTYNYKGIKVIPTIHPKEVIKFNKWKKRVLRDWSVIATESKTPDFPYIPDRKFYIYPTQDELAALTESINVDSDKLALDIETDRRKKITCVGFSLNKSAAYVLPLITAEDQDNYLPWIKMLCECDVDKVLQNGLYDCYWLDSYGISVNKYIYDLLYMHHAIDPIESHDLAFLASYYTRNNYWKDEAKDSEESSKYISNLDALWHYNGLDCCITRELCDILETELSNRGIWNFYIRHYTHLYEPLLKTMRHGVNVEAKQQKAWADKLLRQAKKLREELAETAGEDLYAAKGFSPLKLKKFFYETLKLPEQVKRTKKKDGDSFTVTLDETAIKRLSFKFPKKIGNHGLKVLKVRSLNKKASVLKKGWDNDSRIRCSYKLNTEQGRLSSAKNPMGKGYNLQNIEREPGGIRKTFVPDHGCLFGRVDLSQSEDRFCKMYTRSPRMVEQANLRPHEYDSHIENAKIIFPKQEITKELRNIGKMAVHASQRKMMGKTLADRLLAKMDLIKTPKQCQIMINNYLKANPEIEADYFPFVEKQIIGAGILANSWGRMIDFTGYMVDNNLFRKGYSFYLQSENADLIQQLGYKPIYAFIKDNHLRSRINLQVHDELIFSCPYEEAYIIGKTLVKSLETPRKIMGNWLSVPANFSIGLTWDSLDCVEFKTFPEEGEFEHEVKKLIERGRA